MKKTGDHSLSNADITLITSRITDGDEVTAHLKRKYNINTRNTYDHDKQRSRSKKMAFFMGDSRVKATTIHSFKGWESRMVVLYITEAETQEDMACIYAGLTRLRTHPKGSWMTVVSKSTALQQYGKNFLITKTKLAFDSSVSFLARQSTESVEALSPLPQTDSRSTLPEFLDTA